LNEEEKILEKDAFEIIKKNIKKKYRTTIRKKRSF